LQSTGKKGIICPYDTSEERSWIEKGVIIKPKEKIASCKESKSFSLLYSYVTRKSFLYKKRSTISISG